MDPVAIKDKILEFLKKYRYAALVVAVGLLLMTLPGKNEAQQTTTAPQDTTKEDTSAGDQLKNILRKIQGVGEVEVLLTYAYGERIIYQTDSNVSQGADNSSSRNDTVIITDAERAESGLVTQVIPPGYMGAVIVCQGADSASVRLAVVEAVCNVTGLSSDKVSVLKMK